MADCYLEAAESDCAIDQQRAGLKSVAQSVSCYVKDTLFRHSLFSLTLYFSLWMIDVCWLKYYWLLTNLLTLIHYYIVKSSFLWFPSLFVWVYIFSKCLHLKWTILWDCFPVWLLVPDRYPIVRPTRFRPRTHWRYNTCHLAWECLGIPQEELENVAVPNGALWNGGSH